MRYPVSCIVFAVAMLGSVATPASAAASTVQPVTCGSAPTVLYPPPTAGCTQIGPTSTTAARAVAAPTGTNAPKSGMLPRTGLDQLTTLLQVAGATIGVGALLRYRALRMAAARS